MFQTIQHGVQSTQPTRQLAVIEIIRDALTAHTSVRA